MLTAEQNTVLKNYINGRPEWASLPNINVGNSVIAEGLNAIASPAFTVWRSSISMSDILRAFVAADWTEVDGLTAGKARIWDWLRDLGTVDPSSPAIRAAIEECWKGTAARLAVQGRVLASCKRDARLIEQLLATGTGTPASPANLVFEGIITPDEIETARAS